MNQGFLDQDRESQIEWQHLPHRKEAAMPGPKPPKIELTEAERLALEQVVRRHTAAQQLAARCRIVLAAAAGLNNTQIARKEGICIEMAALWRQRWLSFQAIPLDELSVEERLTDLPRPGAPARITAEQVCQIIAMACETPGESGRPISQWSQREIADEIMKRGIVESISPRQAGRFLKRGRSQAPS
jgi:putative transposase